MSTTPMSRLAEQVSGLVRERDEARAALNYETQRADNATRACDEARAIARRLRDALGTSDAQMTAASDAFDALAAKWAKERAA